MIGIAYQGIPGAYSHQAAQLFFSQEKRLDCRGVESFDNVFGSVAKRQTTYGCIPIENSLAGSIISNYHALKDFPGFIVGELYLRITHCLLALPGAKLQNIKTVYSHPQAIAQCKTFLKKNPHINVEATLDTASAARKVKEAHNPTQAAIGSSLAGELYELETIKTALESHEKNYTRFLIIGNKPNETKANKLSLLYSVTHTPGSLWRSLGAGSRHQINLTKIESIPIIGRPGEYYFFVDFETEKTKDAQNALRELRKETLWIKELGWYTKGKTYED